MSTVLGIVLVRIQLVSVGTIDIDSTAVPGRQAYQLRLQTTGSLLRRNPGTVHCNSRGTTSNIYILDSII
eukprot:SAG31_NODE_471_length_15238_cov_14.684554_1_plen_70_part_00